MNCNDTKLKARKSLDFVICMLYNISMKKIIVNGKYNGKKLNKILLDEVVGLTYSLLVNTLRKKDIKVNGKRTNKDIEIHTGDEILVYISDELLKQKKYDTEVTIIYEDDNILVYNKPQGIEVTGENSLTLYTHKKYSNLGFLPMPCHRIDRNTSGLVLFAKNQEALNILLEKFKLHEIKKHYYAWVYSIPKEKQKCLTAYLFKDNKKAKVYISDKPQKGYRKIVTKYKVIKENEDNTCILDIEIQTGRTHQIRAHLAHIGMPIIGDGKYGRNEINKKFNKKRQCLCSYSLEFEFKGNNGLLDYLNGKKIYLNKFENENYYK